MKKLLTLMFATLVAFSLTMPVFAAGHDEAAPTTKTKKTKATKTKATKAAKTKASKTTAAATQ
jgi:hypothetical protein